MKNKNSFNIHRYLCDYFENGEHKLIEHPFDDEKFIEYFNIKRFTPSLKFCIKNCVHQIVCDGLDNKRDKDKLHNYFGFFMDVEYVYCKEESKRYIHFEIKYYDRHQSFLYPLYLTYMHGGFGGNPVLNDFYGFAYNFYHPILESKSFADILINQIEYIKQK